MAIVADLIASKGTVRLVGGVRADALEMPPVKVDRIAAAGFTDITMDAEVFLFHNLSTSQTVYIRVNVDADNTAAADADTKSVRVEAGETFTFGLPVDTDASGYRLSVA